MSNAKLIAEARQWARTETYEETTAAVIRKLADALEEAERNYARGFSAGFEAATGRKPKFSEIRSHPGMNGFPVSDA